MWLVILLLWFYRSEYSNFLPILSLNQNEHFENLWTICWRIFGPWKIHKSEDALYLNFEDSYMIFGKLTSVSNPSSILVSKISFSITPSLVAMFVRKIFLKISIFCLKKLPYFLWKSFFRHSRSVWISKFEMKRFWKKCAKKKTKIISKNLENIFNYFYSLTKIHKFVM